MLSPRKTIQILISNPPMIGSPIQKIIPDRDQIDYKLKIVLMALEIERLHKIAIHITEKYNDKIDQLQTTQQILNDKIENLELRIGTLNQQLLLKDDFINDIFEDKCPDDASKKLIQQLKLVTNQLNRAKKQIETLDEMNIIFKKNPPENPELIDRIKQLESDYDVMLQKKDQEITNLKIRNSSYDNSNSRDYSDYRSELTRLQMENQFLTDKIESLLEDNEQMKHQIQKGVPKKLITQVIQQEQFNAFTDFQLLDSRPESFHQSPQPKRTPKQNSPEFSSLLKKLQQLQISEQFTPEIVLSQIRLIATLLHLKRMEMPDDLNDTKVTYLNQIEGGDLKKDQQSDLASTIKPKKLFTFNDRDNTQEKQLRSQSIRSSNPKQISKNQFIQVDFYDRKQLEQIKHDYSGLKNEYDQLQKLLAIKQTNESYQRPLISQSDAQNSIYYDEDVRQSQNHTVTTIKVIDACCQVNNSFHELQQLEEENNILKKQIVKQDEENLNLKFVNSKLSEQINLSKEHQKLMNDEISNLKNKILDKTSQLKTMTNEKSSQVEKQENQEESSQTIEILEQQLNDLKIKNNNSNEQQLALEALKSQSPNETNEVLIENDNPAELSNQQILRNRIDELNSNIILLEKENQRLKADHQLLFQLQDQNQQLVLKLADLEQQNQNLQKEIDEVKSLKLLNQEEINQDNQSQLQELNNDKLEQLQSIFEITKTELQEKQLDIDQLHCENERLEQLIDQLKQENQYYQQLAKDQEIEYQSQLSQIRFRISVLEDQQMKEHSRSVSISENDEKKQSDYSVPNSNEVKKNTELEAQIRKLLDEKFVLFDQMQFQSAEYKTNIGKLTEEYQFQKLQLEEKIKDLEKRIVLYLDGDQKLMIENQNLANQIANLTNQLSLARQQQKVQSQKFLVSPRSSVDAANSQLKEKEQIILSLQKDCEKLQDQLQSVQFEKAELANQMQELQCEVVNAANEQYNYNKEIADYKQENLDLQQKLWRSNQQQIELKKLNRDQTEQYQLKINQLSSRQVIQTRCQATQLNTQIYDMDENTLREKENIIYSLKKQLQQRETQLEDALYNLQQTTCEVTRIQKELQKLQAGNHIQTVNKSQSPDRRYQQCALYETRQYRIYSNQRCSNSEEHQRTVSQNKFKQQITLWKQKYEKVLHEMYQKDQTLQQYKQQYENLVVKFDQMKTSLDQELELNNKMRQIMDQLQVSLLETKSSIVNSQNTAHDLCVKREQELFSDAQRFKIQLENTQQENEGLKLKIKQFQEQNLQVQQLKEKVFSFETEKQTLLIQIIEKDELLKSSRQLKSQLDQLKLENQGLMKQIELIKSSNSDSQLIQEKERQAYSKQQMQQQQIQELDDKCHALVNELNALKSEYYKLSYNYSSYEVSKQISPRNQNIQIQSEIMNNLDIIRQELRTYQQKCQVQENELIILRQQFSQKSQRVIPIKNYREQDQYLTEIIKDLEVTKSQNENLRKQNTELSEYQCQLLKEIQIIKRQNVVTVQQYYQIQNQDKTDDGKQWQFEQLRSDVDSLKKQIFSPTNNNSIKEAEKLSLQARVLTLEQQLKTAQGQIEKLQYLIQENQDLRVQVRTLKETNTKMQQIVIQKTQPNDMTQIERLNRELTEKISELTQLKIKYKQALSTVQRSENRLM